MNHPRGDVYKEIEWFSKNGFDFIDFSFEPPQNHEFKTNDIKTAINDSGLEVVGHTNPHLPAIYPIQTIKDASLDELKIAADFFALIGAHKMNIHTFYEGALLTDQEKIEANIALLKELVKHCQGLDIELMLENDFVGFIDTPEKFKLILNEIPDLKIHLDVAHANINQSLPETLTEFFNIFRTKIIHLHLHDNNGSADEHLPIGCGEINWLDTLHIIKTGGFDDTITLEVFCPDRQYLLYSKEKIKNLWNNI